MLLGDTLRSMVQYRLRWDQIFEQMYFIGIRSQVVVLTTGAFTGAVFAAQVWFQFKRFGMESAIGPTVSVGASAVLFAIGGQGGGGDGRGA
jgi:phospholipid/cholesterol/gamma-HCH transport system permease protein